MTAIQSKQSEANHTSGDIQHDGTARQKCTYTPFTRSSKHRADIEQTSSKHRAGSSS